MARNSNLGWQIIELMKFAQTDDVKPSYIEYPASRFKSHRIEIKSCSSFNQGLELLKNHENVMALEILSLINS